MTRELYTHVCIYSSHRAHSSSPEPTRCVRNSIANHKPTPYRPKDTTYLNRHLLVSVRPRYVSLDHMPIVQPRILSASIDNKRDARCSYDSLMSLRRAQDRLSTTWELQRTQRQGPATYVCGSRVKIRAPRDPMLSDQVIRLS